MRYLRDNGYDYCDAELAMVMDTVTGKPERFSHGESIGSLEDAISYVAKKDGWEDRTVIVKLHCIKPYQIDAN